MKRIVFSSGYEYTNNTLSELKKHKSYKVVNPGSFTGIIFVDLFVRLIRKLSLKLFHVKKDFSKLYRFQFSRKDNYDYVFVYDSSEIATSKKFIDYIRLKHKSVKIVLMVLNSIDQHQFEEYNSVGYDYIYSFDPQNCQDFNLHYFEYIFYNSYKLESQNSSTKSDVYFIGADKGRKELLNLIYENAIEKGIKTDFYVFTNDKNQPSKHGYSILNKKLTYKEILNSVLKSKCILEIVKAGQTGYTMRVAEAITFNKILITNNKSIVDTDYYRTGNIYLFDKAEDIDWTTIKSRKNITYNYDERFYPTRVFSKIIEEINMYENKHYDN